MYKTSMNMKKLIVVSLKMDKKIEKVERAKVFKGGNQIVN